MQSINGYYEDVAKLRMNPQLLSLRLRGDKDEIDQFISILRQNEEDGVKIKSIKSEKGFKIVSLSKRVSAKTLLCLMADNNINNVQILKPIRASAIKSNFQQHDSEIYNSSLPDSELQDNSIQENDDNNNDNNNNNNNNNDNNNDSKNNKINNQNINKSKCSNNNNLEEEESLIYHNKHVKGNDKKLEEEEEEQSLYCHDKYVFEKKSFPRNYEQVEDINQILSDLIKVIFKNRFDYDQLIEYVVNKSPSKLSSTYMHLMTRIPYCDQIEKALEIITKCKFSRVKQERNAYTFNNEESDQCEMQEDGDEEGENLENLPHQSRYIPQQMLHNYEEIQRNQPQQIQKMSTNNIIPNAVSRTLDTVHKDITQKAAQSNSQSIYSHKQGNHLYYEEIPQSVLKTEQNNSKPKYSSHKLNNNSYDEESFQHNQKTQINFQSKYSLKKSPNQCYEEQQNLTIKSPNNHQNGLNKISAGKKLYNNKYAQMTPTPPKSFYS